MKLIRRSALLVTAFGSLALGGEARAQSSAGSGTPLDRWEEGQVRSVDAAKGRISFGAGRSAETNYFTLIEKNGDPASLRDIQPGDEVRAAFFPNDPFHPVRIEVFSAPAKKTADRTGAPGPLPASDDGA